ncbi:MAG: D-2-hydroxyacid dehydrogenase [Halobacteriales archaeon]
MSVDVAVLRQKLHGLEPDAYAEAIRDRLTDADVRLARTPGEERDLLESAQAATGATLDPSVLETAENLELFACVYAGTDHLPMDDLADRGVAVTNASGVHGPNIAEHVVGAMLAFARRFPTAWRRGERREWRSFSTREIKDSTVTVIGLGAIGTAVAERLEPFGVHTIGIRYTPEKGGPTDEVLGLESGDVHNALSRSEYVVVAAPLTDETEGLIDGSALLTMPSDAVLVNVGRGAIVDTDALVKTLQTNGIRGAALDVTDPEPLPPDHELWSFDNVFVTPHNAGHTPRYWDRRADILARNLAAVDETGQFEDLENQVV